MTSEESELRWFQTAVGGALVLVCIVAWLAVASIRGCADADAARARGCAQACGERGVVVAPGRDERSLCLCGGER